MTHTREAVIKAIEDFSPLRSVTMHEMQLALIKCHLKQSQGHVKKAADSLGMSNKAIYNWVRTHEIDLGEFRDEKENTLVTGKGR